LDELTGAGVGLMTTGAEVVALLEVVDVVDDVVDDVAALVVLEVAAFEDVVALVVDVVLEEVVEDVLDALHSEDFTRDPSTQQ